MTIGERIHNRRKELHLTLEDVSRLSGIPKSTIQRWESGAVTNMGQENLSKVADALNVSIGFLQTGIAITAQAYKRPAIDDTDIFEFLCAKSQYRYATHIGPDRYYEKKGQEFVLANPQAVSRMIDQVAHYFSFLMHDQSISLEEFLSKSNADD